MKTRIYTTIESGWRSRFLAVALPLAILFIAYQFEHFTYAAVPGNNSIYPFGWWGWADQSHYLNSSIAFASGDFSPGSHHYPPLYPFLGSLFLPISTQHSYWLPNLLLMLGYGAIFLRLTTPYIGAWPAAATMLLGMVAFPPLRLQWVVPWTSTLSAFLLASALFLLDRHSRKQGTLVVDAGIVGRNSFLFGMAIGAQAATRPVDLAVMLPIALIYTAIVLRDAIWGRDWVRRNAFISAGAGLAGFVPFFVGWLAFNYTVYGALLGGSYFATTGTFGFFPADIGEKLYSHWLNSASFYGEPGQDWLTKLPLIAISLVFLPIALFARPLVFRAAGAAAFVQFSIYYAFSDIIPSGTFQFFNIHYFKWLPPLSLAMGWFVVRGVFDGDNEYRAMSRRGLAGACVLSIAAFSVTTSYRIMPLQIINQSEQLITLRLPAEEIDFIEIPGVQGIWTSIFFATGLSVQLDGRLINKPRDYHAIPVPGGMRLLFVRPTSGTVLSIKFREGTRLTNDVAAQVEAVSVGFDWNLLHRTRGPAIRPPNYKYGTELTFSSGGTAERYLRKGWSGGEKWGRRIDGATAGMLLRIEPPPASDLHLTLMMGAFIAPHRPQSEVKVLANSCSIGQLRLTEASARRHALRIPAHCVGTDRVLRLTFATIDPISPRSVGVNTDSRLLGLNLVSLRLDEAGRVSPTP